MPEPEHDDLFDEDEDLDDTYINDGVLPPFSTLGEDSDDDFLSKFFSSNRGIGLLSGFQKMWSRVEMLLMSFGAPIVLPTKSTAVKHWDACRLAPLRQSSLPSQKQSLCDTRNSSHLKNLTHIKTKHDWISTHKQAKQYNQTDKKKLNRSPHVISITARPEFTNICSFFGPQQKYKNILNFLILINFHDWNGTLKYLDRHNFRNYQSTGVFLYLNIQTKLWQNHKNRQNSGAEVGVLQTFQDLSY